MTFLFYFQLFLLDGYFITQNESIRFMRKDMGTIVYGLLSSCDYRYCFANDTRSGRKQAILDRKCSGEATSVSLKK